MTARKRRAEVSISNPSSPKPVDELQALPSDESGEEEEYIDSAPEDTSESESESEEASASVGEPRAKRRKLESEVAESTHDEEELEELEELEEGVVVVVDEEDDGEDKEGVVIGEIVEEEEEEGEGELPSDTESNKLEIEEVDSKVKDDDESDESNPEIEVVPKTKGPRIQIPTGTATAVEEHKSSIKNGHGIVPATAEEIENGGDTE